MIIKEIKNLTHAEFEELRNIYVSTFPYENAITKSLSNSDCLSSELDIILRLQEPYIGFEKSMANCNGSLNAFISRVATALIVV